MFYKEWVPKALRSYETKTFGKIKQVQKVDLTEQKELLKNNEKLNKKKNMSLVLT